MEIGHFCILCRNVIHYFSGMNICDCTTVITTSSKMQISCFPKVTVWRSCSWNVAALIIQIFSYNFILWLRIVLTIQIQRWENVYIIFDTHTIVKITLHTYELGDQVPMILILAYVVKIMIFFQKVLVVAHYLKKFI